MFWENMFQVVCCKIVVWGKRLNHTICTTSRLLQIHFVLQNWRQIQPLLVYIVFKHLNPFPLAEWCIYSRWLKSWKYRCKRRNCSWWAIPPFATMYSNQYSINIFSFIEISFFFFFFKIVCCRFDINGTRLRGPYTSDNMNKLWNTMFFKQN